MDIGSISSTYVNQATAALDMERKTTESFESALKAAQLNGDDAEILKACQDFESYFVNLLFKEMRKTAPIGGALPKSYAEQTFQEMLDERVADNAAKAGGIGLAQFMYRQMTQSSTNKIDW